MTVKNNQLELPFTQADKNKLDGVEVGAKSYTIATQAEAQAGLDNAKLMTPLRVAQAISALGGEGGGGGEANTASNVGNGAGVFRQKTGVNLEFRSLVAGTGVSLTQGANTIIINANPGGLSSTDDLAEGATNKYYTEARVSANSSVQAALAKVSADGSINTHSDVTINSPQNNQVLAWNGSAWVNATLTGGSGEANDGTNVGQTGGNTAGVYKGKISTTLQFKRLVGGTNVTITENTNDITIAAAGGGGSGHVTQYLTFDGGNIAILATGTSADLETVTATKDFGVASVSRLLLNRPSSIQYHSVAVTFTSSETAGRTECRVEVPDPNGATLLSKAIRPIAFRLGATSNVAATGGTISLSGSTVVLAHTSYTAGTEQRMVVQF
jgi:hypothetical protein